MLSLLNQFVPTVSTDKTVPVPGIEEPVQVTTDTFHKIALGKSTSTCKCSATTCTCIWKYTHVRVNVYSSLCTFTIHCRR